VCSSDLIEIVNALELNISFEEQQSLARIPTQNIEAYKLFLRGRKEADKRNKESIAKSIVLYQQALVLDPNYADALAEIANSVYLETYYSGRDPIEASKTANEYLDKAEAISDKVSRIYSVRGLIFNIEGRSDEAKIAFKRSIKLSPNDLTARHQFSTYYYYNQEYEKQLEQAEIAYRLDPLSFATANSYFTALTANFKYDEAEQLMKKIEKSSDSNNKFVINRSYFRLYIDKKDYKSAIVPLKKIVDEQPVFNRFLGFCYGKIGDTVNAYKTIETIKNTPNDFMDKERNHQLAVVFAGLNEADSVLYYLDTIRNNQVRMLRRERSEFFGFLKNDPRFLKLLAAHGIENNKN
jgi:tetratricopeptide (TPR) repeat protein